MEIVRYSPVYAKAIADIYYQAVHAIDSVIYSNEQKNVWAPAPINYEQWQRRLSAKQPYLLLHRGELAGFIELESDGHIDCVYVSPTYQRKGVASTLLNHVITVAKKKSLKQLYVEASIMAKPLFEKFGFHVENENHVIRDNIVLLNYSMRVDI